MQKVAIIDIGSNSIRLVLFEIYKNHSFRVIDDIKESPRLGEGIFANGLMKQENMDKALETLVLFRSLWEHRGVTEILAFGTAAVRTAKNSKDFLDRIKKNCNIDVTVLSLCFGKSDYYISGENMALLYGCLRTSAYNYS